MLNNKLFYAMSAALLLQSVSIVYAGTTADAVQQGKSFGLSTLPSSASSSTSSGNNLNNATITATETPLYTTEQPASGGFSSGIGLFNQGAGAIDKCANYVSTGDKVADQECAGVNFLAKNPIQAQFTIGSNDPSLIAAQNAVLSAEDDSTPGNQCVMKSVVTASAVYSTQTCMEASITDRLTCEDILSCTVERMQSKCTPAYFRCTPSASSCCYFQITCNGDKTANVKYHDCCDDTYSVNSVNMSRFTSPGVVYNGNPLSTLVCDQTTGRCTVNFTNYHCGNPLNSTGYYPNVNSFSFELEPIFICAFNGGCDDLDARSN